MNKLKNWGAKGERWVGASFDDSTVAQREMMEIVVFNLPSLPSRLAVLSRIGPHQFRQPETINSE